MNSIKYILLIFSLFLCLSYSGNFQLNAQDNPEEKTYKVAFSAFGGMIGSLEDYEDDFNIDVQFFQSEDLREGKVDLSSYDLVLLDTFMGLSRTANDEERRTLIKKYKNMILEAKKKNPDLILITSITRSQDPRFPAVQNFFKQNMPELIEDGTIIADTVITNYRQRYNLSVENSRRMLLYIVVTYLKRDFEILPPEELKNRCLYHPDHDKFFETVEEYKQWREKQDNYNENAYNVVIMCPVHHIVALMQNVVDGLVREFEKQGIFAVVMNSMHSEVETMTLKLKPNLIVGGGGPRTNRDSFYKKLGVPHMINMTMRALTIDEWKSGDTARTVGPMSMSNYELDGLIEPIVVGGLIKGNAPECLSPIKERINHFVNRASSWIKLAKKKNKDKKILMYYWDEIIPYGSIFKTLVRMKEEGYDLSDIPMDVKELVEWIDDHGKQIDNSLPWELDKMARSGNAVLVPVEEYLKWFEAKVPADMRKEVIKEWGEAPGDTHAWTDDDGNKFIVLPKIDLGRVVLMPLMFPEDDEELTQENRKKLLKKLNDDPYAKPSHNLLASYFWCQEEFKPDAMVVWSEFALDLLLPLKTVGLRNNDWPDILMGNIPNIRPFSISMLTFSIPAKRRTLSVLIDKLTSPKAVAELSDELLNISDDIVSWDRLEDGSLKERFRMSITQQFLKEHLDIDMKIDLKDGRLLTPDEIYDLSAYLNEIHGEKIEMRPHTFGEPPVRDLLIPQLATCLRKAFLDELEKILVIPEDKNRLPGEKKKYLRAKAEELIAHVVDEKFNPLEALEAIGGKVGDVGISKELSDLFDMLKYLIDGYAKTHQEMDNLIMSLNGGFVPAGPANPPERNPYVVPTGRNMYSTDPYRIPSKQSWELGKQLIDQLLADKIKDEGKYPEKIAFTINPRRTTSDYGLNESQIFYLLGVRPVWDASNRVYRVELIPTEELKRPRIDVIIEASCYYAEYLESRMRLLDQAVQLVANLDEPDNYVYKNRLKVQQQLLSEGKSIEEANILSCARIFSLPADKFDSSIFFELFIEKTGLWDDRKELVDVYIAEHDYVYTEKMWGKKANSSYKHHLKDTDIVMRSLTHWSPLSGFSFYSGGNLSLVIKELSGGKEPEYLLSDLRFVGEEKIVNAEQALRKDFRALLFNRKWIEEMMRSGAEGAGRMAFFVMNTFGWKVNRENSITDDIWEEIYNIYVKDSKEVHLPQWFDNTNPDAYIDLTVKLIEAIRKDMWVADEQTTQDIVEAYVKTSIRHGSAHDNEKMEKFIEQVLNAPGNVDMQQLYQEYLASFPQPETPTDAEQETDSKEVEGNKLEQKEIQKQQPQQQQQPSESGFPWFIVIIASVVLVLVIVGFKFRTGVSKNSEQN